MANTPISLLDTLNLHVLSFLISMIFYDCMSTLSWVHDPRSALYVQVLFSYVSLYKCVCRHFHVIPLCSRHDLITLRFHYPGPLLPSSLASQDYLVWYLRWLAAQPFLNVCMVSLIMNSDLSMHLSFLSEFPLSYGTLGLSCIDSIAT